MNMLNVDGTEEELKILQYNTLNLSSLLSPTGQPIPCEEYWEVR